MPRPDTPAHHLLDQAVKAFRTGQLDHAQSLCEQALKNQPRLARAQHLAGLIAKQKKLLDAAITRLTLANQIEPHNPFILRDLADTCLQLGQARQAVGLISQAIDRAPDMPELYSILGLALAASGQFEPAIRAHRHVLEQLPPSALAHFNLGHAYQQAKQHEMAQACLQSAIALEPAMEAAWLGLAEIAQDQGRYQDACHAYAHYLALVPSDAARWRKQAELYFRLYDFGRAFTAMAKAIGASLGARFKA